MFTSFLFWLIAVEITAWGFSNTSPSCLPFLVSIGNAWMIISIGRFPYPENAHHVAVDAIAIKHTLGTLYYWTVGHYLVRVRVLFF